MNSDGTPTLGEVKALASVLNGRFHTDTSNFTSLRKGTIVSEQAGSPSTYTITLSGDTAEIPGIYSLDSFSPSVDDVVVLGKQGGSLLILGKVGNYAGGGSSDVFNVKDYGATGLGSSTDDTDAFQDAIDAATTFASTSGVKATVLVPPDTYRVDGTVQLKDNITLYCQGAIIKSYAYNASMFSSLSSGSADNLHVIGGVFDAQGQNAATDTHYNIMTVFNSENIKWENVTFRNVAGWHAIDLEECDGVQILNCRFEGFTDNSTGSVRSFSEAIQLDTDGISNVPCSNVYVSGCYMGPAIDGSGLGAFGKLVGSHVNIVDAYYDNIHVTGNRIVDAIDVAIQGASWRNSVIANNVIVSPASDGIRLYQDVNNTGERISVTGNVIEDAGARGIYFDGNASQVFRNCTITDNTIENSTSSAIRVEYFNFGNIAGNQIYDGTSQGIYLINASDTLIASNNVNLVDETGIQVEASARVAVEANRTFDTGKHGIRVAGASTHTTVSGNTCTAASRASNGSYGTIEVSAAANDYTCIINNRLIMDGGSTSNYAPRPIHFVTTPTATGVQVGGNSYKGWAGEQGVMVETVSGAGTTTVTGTFNSLSDTADPSITMTTGTCARVSFKAFVNNSNANNVSSVGIEISGATTRAATFDAQLQGVIAGGKNSVGATLVFTNLTPGINTFTIKYRAFTSGTLTGELRELSVEPIAQ